MIGSDNTVRAKVSGFVARGIGLNPTFRCAKCDQPRSTLGSKYVGPLRLKHCAGCLAAKGAA